MEQNTKAKIVSKNLRIRQGCIKKRSELRCLIAFGWCGGMLGWLFRWVTRWRKFARIWGSRLPSRKGGRARERGTEREREWREAFRVDKCCVFPLSTAFTGGGWFVIYQPLIRGVKFMLRIFDCVPVPFNYYEFLPPDSNIITIYTPFMKENVLQIEEIRYPVRHLCLIFSLTFPSKFFE